MTEKEQRTEAARDSRVSARLPEYDYATRVAQRKLSMQVSLARRAKIITLVSSSKEVSSCRNLPGWVLVNRSDRNGLCAATRRRVHSLLRL